MDCVVSGAPEVACLAARSVCERGHPFGQTLRHRVWHAAEGRNVEVTEGSVIPLELPTGGWTGRVRREMLGAPV